MALRAQHGVDELHRRKIAPVQIFEDEHNRAGRAFGRHEILPRDPHLIAHQDRVAPRRAELHAVAIGKRCADELAQKLGHPHAVGFGHVPCDALAKLSLSGFEGLGLGNSARPSKHLRDEAERRTRSHRIATTNPDFRWSRVVAGTARPSESGDQFVAQSRLACACCCRDENRPRHGLFDALLESRLERRDLAFAADAKGGFAEERPRFFVQLDSSRARASVDLEHFESGAQKPRCDFIEHDRAGLVLLGLIDEQAGCPIDGFAGKQRSHGGSTGGECHRPAGKDRPKRQRALRRLRREIARNGLSRQHGQEGSVGRGLETGPRDVRRGCPSSCLRPRHPAPATVGPTRLPTSAVRARVTKGCGWLTSDELSSMPERSAMSSRMRRAAGPAGRPATIRHEQIVRDRAASGARSKRAALPRGESWRAPPSRARPRRRGDPSSTRTHASKRKNVGPSVDLLLAARAPARRHVTRRPPIPPARVRVAAPTRATPKSRIFTPWIEPPGKKRLLGLMSR
jgi:hypothetical protein